MAETLHKLCPAGDCEDALRQLLTHVLPRSAVEVQVVCEQATSHFLSLTTQLNALKARLENQGDACSLALLASMQKECRDLSVLFQFQDRHSQILHNLTALLEHPQSGELPDSAFPVSELRHLYRQILQGEALTPPDATQQEEELF